MTPSIKPIDAGSVHQIHAGQVVLELQGAIKELVENSLDAGATQVEVRIKDHGLETVEVIDNGSGIAEADWPLIGRKHHTSKLEGIDSLPLITTFGFRGEALASLCALCDSVQVTTSTQETAPMGSIIKLGRDGSVVDNSGRVARPRGTTVLLSGLFKSLPVRRKEFERTVKREFTKALTTLYAYALVPSSVSPADGRTGVRLKVDSVGAGKATKRSTLLATDGRGSLRSSVTSVWGHKALEGVLDVELDLEVEVDSVMARREGIAPGTQTVHVSGLISSAAWGQGRSSPDRQFYYINGRPCDLKQVGRAVNEVYKSFNTNQVPLAILDFKIPPESVDINVSPDKRTILLHSEANLIIALKSALEAFFAPSRSSFALSGASQTVKMVQETQTTLNVVRQTQAAQAVSEDIEEEDEPDVRAGEEEHEEKEEEEEEEEEEEDQLEETQRSTLPSARIQGERRSSEAGLPRRPSSQHVPSDEEDVQPAPISRRSRTSSRQTITIDEDEDEPTSSAPSRSSRSSRQPRIIPIEEAASQPPCSPPPSQRSEPEFQFEGEVEILDTPRASQSNQHKAPVSPAPARVVRHTLDTTGASWSPERMRAAKPVSRIIAKGDGPKMELRRKLAGFASQSAPVHDSESEDEGSVRDGSWVEKNGEEQGWGEEDDEGAADEAEDAEEEGGVEDARTGEAEDSPAEGAEGAAEDEDEPMTDNDLDDGQKLSSAALAPKEPAVATLDTEETMEVEDVDEGSSESTQVGTNGGTMETHTPSRPPIHEKSSSSYRDEIQTTAIQGEMTLRFDMEKVRLRHASKSQNHSRLARQSRDAFTAVAQASVVADAGISNRDMARAEEALSRVISKDDFGRMEVLGQFNRGFIIARLRSPTEQGQRGSDDLFIIDQHASDEKFNFETLQRTTVIKAQSLIKPRALQLTAGDEIVAMENMDVLRANGFEVVVDEDKAPGRGERIFLAAMPVSKDTTFDFKDLEQLLHLLSDGARPAGQMVRCSKARSMFAMRACRKSVMIGKALTRAQMVALLRNMGTIDQPWNCPHGRPTMRHLVQVEQPSKSRAGSDRIDWAKWKRQNVA